jgi:prepilin-type N-terminal cleavage/methylation domain-containing protein
MDGALRVIHRTKKLFNASHSRRSSTAHHLKHLAAVPEPPTPANNDLEKGDTVNILRERLSLAGTQQSGFSLIEVVVALFVFTLIATGTAYTLLSVLSLNRDSRVRHIATNVAAEEIDLAHDSASLVTLGNNAHDRTVGTDTFHVTRTTQWVAGTGVDDACGARAGALTYKRINVEVRWNGMRDGSTPARADTIVAPNTHLNTADTGTILASVTGASGAGTPGVTVRASLAGGGAVRASAVTDADGCAFLTGVAPGSYDVTASRSGYISADQSLAPTVNVPIAAGSSGGAAFQLDRARTVRVEYATNRPNGTVYFPTNLVTSRITAAGLVSYAELSGRGTTVNTSRSSTAQLYPFDSGYSIVAGKYLASVTSPTTPPTPGSSVTGACLSPDPLQWPAVTEAGVTRVGTRAVAITDASGTATARVPMGIVTVKGIPAGATLTATTAAPPAGSGDPGCATPVAYTFSAVADGSTIALPFGTWTLSTTVGTVSRTVSASSLILESHGVITARTNTVTLDPREAP